MVELTYAEDRAVFERDIFRPPHLARMLETAGHYVSRMGPRDREAILGDALLQFWERRNNIRGANDVRRIWIQALNWAAAQRETWQVWFRWGESTTVVGKKWRGRQ